MRCFLAFYEFGNSTRIDSSTQGTILAESDGIHAGVVFPAGAGSKASADSCDVASTSETACTMEGWRPPAPFSVLLESWGGLQYFIVGFLASWGASALPHGVACSRSPLSPWQVSFTPSGSWTVWHQRTCPSTLGKSATLTTNVLCWDREAHINITLVHVTK